MKYIIYKIQINDYIYIGSTMNFTIRKAQHKKKCNIYKDRLVYKTIIENGGWDCCTMVPIKEIDVESKRHAEMVEEAVRLEYNAHMNSKRAYRTVEEKKEYQKEYKQTPEYKEKQKQYQKQFYQTEERKEYKKQYRQTPEYKEYQKQYRLAKLADSPEIKV